jgi:hypothetical protein
LEVKHDVNVFCAGGTFLVGRRKLAGPAFRGLASNMSVAFTRSPNGRLRANRASTRYVRSTSMLLTSQNGTRFHPPVPFMVL